MSGTIQVRGWDTYQHYKKRNPPWVKLYRSLLSDHDLMRLPVASRWLAVGLLVIASETDNEIPNDLDWLRWRLRLESEPDIAGLVSAGFITVSQDASDPIAPRQQNALPETEGETEGETETEELTALVPSEVERIVEVVNEIRNEAGMASLRGGDKAGRRYINARLTEHGFEIVERVVRYAPSDPWIAEGQKLALAPLFSPKSFPALLDRMENPNDSGLSAADRRLINHRERLEQVSL